MNIKYDIALSFATEEQHLVEKVYHYLRAHNLSVFYAPAPECQALLSGKNQREIFYSVFGLYSEYVALFVSKNYVKKETPMEEAYISFSKHNNDGNVIPIYLDGTPLPPNMLDPRTTNYFRSNNPADITEHLTQKIKSVNSTYTGGFVSSKSGNVFNANGNSAGTQCFIQNYNEGNRS